MDDFGNEIDYSALLQSSSVRMACLFWLSDLNEISGEFLIDAPARAIGLIR